jgi:hypothetical protein
VDAFFKWSFRRTEKNVFQVNIYFFEHISTQFPPHPSIQSGVAGSKHEKKRRDLTAVAVRLWGPHTAMSSFFGCGFKLKIFEKIKQNLAF